MEEIDEMRTKIIAQFNNGDVLKIVEAKK